jgi:hypothetical protein
MGRGKKITRFVPHDSYTSVVPYLSSQKINTEMPRQTIYVVNSAPRTAKGLEGQ